ncbi:MAG TPA: L,D-transpeptidase family protein, partial [Afipia sp.]
MRDYSTGRTGYDRVLAAVAATFIMTGVALAQSEPPKSPDAAISAAVPVPVPANVPPPTAADIKAEEFKAEAAKAAGVQNVDAPKADAPATNTAAVPAAPATPATSAPATAAVPADATPAVAELSPFGEKLRDLIAAKSAKYFDRKTERAAVEAFYKDRNYAALWTDGAAATTRATSAASRLKDAETEGLNPKDYPIPDFAAAATPDAQADAELKLTESVLDYARHIQSGRMHWSQVTGDILFPDHYPDPAEVLINVSTARDVSAALETYSPPHKLYKALKAKLAELRGVGEDASKRIEEGNTLKFVKPTKKTPDVAAVEDSRVPALRAKLNVENPDDAHYDVAVSDAVRKFQANNGLKATGALDNATVRALNGPKSERQIDIVRVNMERWRWLPRDLGVAALGDAYAILNIPDYSLRVMHNGAPVWTTRVVVGKPGEHATPLMTETMKYITVNPTWNVPPSIIYKEYLPAMQQDPTMLQRMGLKFERNSDGSIHISQPPGADNALGRIRFNFPNKFLVYQHDTPDKYLFAKEERAYSHGCMRVQNPDQYAATLLGIALPQDNYTPEKIRSMYGRGEVNINLPVPIPVNITYQTAFVDDAGKLEFRKDVYGRDAQMIAILKGNSGKDIETVVSRSQPSYSRPTGNIPIPGETTYASNTGQGFFERLFGFGSPQPQPQPQPVPVQARRRAQR